MADNKMKGLKKEKGSFHSKSIKHDPQSESTKSLNNENKITKEKF